MKGILGPAVLKVMQIFSILFSKLNRSWVVLRKRNIQGVVKVEAKLIEFFKVFSTQHTLCATYDVYVLNI